MTSYRRLPRRKRKLQYAAPRYHSSEPVLDVLDEKAADALVAEILKREKTKR